jgi:outer membrane autotransporter protein
VLRLEPFAGAAFVRVATDAFRESGGSAALVGANDNFPSTLSGFGLKVTGFAEMPGAVLRTHAYFGWQHAFGDIDPAATLAFAAGGSPFIVAGAPLAEDSLLLGRGIDAFISDGLCLSAAYTGEIARATEKPSRAPPPGGIDGRPQSASSTCTLNRRSASVHTSSGRQPASAASA